MARKSDPNALTEPIKPKERIRTAKHKVRGLLGKNWVQQEIKRINADPERHVNIAEDNKGLLYMVALPGDPHYIETEEKP